MYYICTPFKKNGLVAERLGSGLQNHLHQFESGRDLNKTQSFLIGFFIFINQLIPVFLSKFYSKSVYQKVYLLND